MQEEIQNLKDSILKLEKTMQVMIAHIRVLEQRDKRLTDCFRLGKYRFRQIDEDMNRNHRIAQIQFTLNEE